MKKIATALPLLISLVALVVAFTHGKTSTVSKEPVYDKVLVTQTLHCGYTNFAPLVSMDPNTKEMSGIMYEIVNEAGKRLGLKVEWNTEVSWSDIAPAFKSNRIDAFCTGLWPGANRATNTLFTNGVFWDPVGVFVRVNDARFGSDPLALNNPDYTVAYAEGDASEVMAKARLPLAKKLPLTQINSIGELFAQVTTKKADGVMGTRLAGADFIEKNPGLIKEVMPTGKPFRIYPITMGLPEGEYGMKKMLDAVIFEMQDDGTVEKIARQYLGDRKNMLYKAQTNYEPL